MFESSGNVEQYNDPRRRSHRPCGARRRLQVGVSRPRRGRRVRHLQTAGRRLPSGIALRVADHEDASALKRALAGIDEASAVMRHHANAIEAATATNIRDITFTSIVDTEELSPFCFSPVYRDAERQLAAAVCLRPSSDVAYIATLFSNIGLS
jgi:hypothetical protein